MQANPTVIPDQWSDFENSIEFFTYRKNILGRQLSQAIYALNTFSDCLITKTSNIFYKIKYDGQSCQTVHRCSMEKLLW